MSSHLNYIAAQERIADLTRAAERARLAQEARKIENGSQLGPIAAIIERLRRPKARRETVRLASPRTLHRPRARPRTSPESAGQAE